MKRVHYLLLTLVVMLGSGITILAQDGDVTDDGTTTTTIDTVPLPFCCVEKDFYDHTFHGSKSGSANADFRIWSLRTSFNQPSPSDATPITVNVHNTGTMPIEVYFRLGNGQPGARTETLMPGDWESVMSMGSEIRVACMGAAGDCRADWDGIVSWSPGWTAAPWEWYAQ